MSPDQAMTGTFKMKLPAELLHAIENHPASNPGNDFQIGAMKPSLIERMIRLFSKKQGLRRH